MTHSGLPKQLHWRDRGASEQRFERFLPKVHAVALDNLDEISIESFRDSDTGQVAVDVRGNDSNYLSSNSGSNLSYTSNGFAEGHVSEAVAAAMLAREVNQRDAIVRALQTLPSSYFERFRGSTCRGRPLSLPYDLVLVSDVDELPRRAAVEALKRRWPHPATEHGNNNQRIVPPVRLVMDWFLYSFDFIAPRPWGINSREGSYAIPYHMLAPSATTAGDMSNRSPGADAGDHIRTGTPSQWRRSLRSHVAAGFSYGRNDNGADAAMGLGVWSTLGGAGWHMSSFGGVAAVRACIEKYY